jgi:hypothetical protein
MAELKEIGPVTKGHQDNLFVPFNTPSSLSPERFVSLSMRSTKDDLIQPLKVPSQTYALMVTSFSLSYSRPCHLCIMANCSWCWWSAEYQSMWWRNTSYAAKLKFGFCYTKRTVTFSCEQGNPMKCNIPAVQHRESRIRVGDRANRSSGKGQQSWPFS